MLRPKQGLPPPASKSAPRDPPRAYLQRQARDWRAHAKATWQPGGLGGTPGHRDGAGGRGRDRTTGRPPLRPRGTTLVQNINHHPFRSTPPSVGRGRGRRERGTASSGTQWRASFRMSPRETRRGKKWIPVPRVPCSLCFLQAPNSKAPSFGQGTC